MSRSQHDPLKDFLVDLFGSDNPRGKNGRVEETAAGKHSALAPFAVIATAFAFYTPQLVELTGQSSEGEVATVAASIHGHRWLALVIALAFVVLDGVRFLSHRYRVGLDAQVRQSTRHLPVKIIVGFPPGISTLRSAKIKLPRGAIIRPKEMDELTSAVRASASRRTGKWTYTITHEAHRDQIVITRKETEPDTRSARHKALDKALKDGPLKDPRVTVDCYDEDGVEIGFKVTFTPSLSSGAQGFQK